MSENNESNEEMFRKISKDMVQKMIEDAMIDVPAPKIVNFGSCEDIVVFNVAGNFIHSVDYMDDPLFLEASESTLGCFAEDIANLGRMDSEYCGDEFKVVDKKPATLTGYLLYNEHQDVIGFSCFSSQVDVNNE
jgi:hypothetical protein